jgi:glycosyltransferase involved in cell wall biosynthesis
LNILFLTDNFPPEVNAPASRTYEHCRAWVKAGNQVTVITCVPNFPTGKIYEGYRNRLYQTEEMDGIKVVRVWSYITANEGFLRRILDYASFMISAVATSPRVQKPDVVVGTSPHFFTVCAAYLVSRFKGVPFIFELRDIWPESIKAVGAMKDSPFIRMLEAVEMFLYRKATMIVSVTDSFKEVLVKRGVPEEKIQVVRNGVDLTRFRPMPKDPELVRNLGLEGKFVAGYVGTHGMAHALETILKAAQKSENSDQPTSPGKINDQVSYFLFLGDGAKKQELMAEAGRRKLSNVMFLNSVPKAEVTRYWSLLDVSIIHLKKTDLFTKVIPSKLFESMGMGIPVLLGVSGESANIVETEGIGLTFEPENPEALYNALSRLRKEPALYERLKERCIQSAVRYDRETQADIMLKLLSSVSRKLRET